MIGFPFDSLVTYDEQGNPSYDRAVSSKPLKSLISKLFTTGVMPNPSDNFQVFAGTEGMTVVVHAGFAIIEGGLKLEEDNRTLEVQASDTTYDRIDTVVLRWNGNDNARICDLYVVEGTPAPTPVRPELNRTGSIYEIGLADVFIPNNSSAISQQRITDTRYDTGRCGIVSSVSEFDTTTLYAQVQADLADFKEEEQADFMEWYAEMQELIPELTAVHLQEEIDELARNAGHKIVDAGGTQLAHKQKMQFVDANVYNTSGDNGETIIENVKEVASADYSSETEDGMYLIPDGEGAVIGPASDDVVEVTADGNKTYGQLLYEIYTDAKFDATKLNENSYIVITSSYYNYTNTFRFEQISSGKYRFVLPILVEGQSSSEIISLVLGSTCSYVSYDTTYHDNTNIKPDSSHTITLYYGNKKAVVDLQTTANRCWMGDGETSVEGAMYVQSHGSQTVIEQPSWDTTTGDTTVTATHTGYLIGTFNVHSCNGGGAYTHGVIVFIDSIPVANIYSQGESTAEANSGSFCIPIKKGQVVIVRVINGTWLGTAYIRY